jgi:hypothetical protein
MAQTREKEREMAMVVVDGKDAEKQREKSSRRQRNLFPSLVIEKRGSAWRDAPACLDP